MKNRIRVLIPMMPSSSEVVSYLEKIDESLIYSNFGPLNSELILRLSNYLGVDGGCIASCANATLGLTGAIQTSQVSSKFTWELPAWTFTATAAAGVAAGVKLQFNDVDSNDRVIPTSQCKALIDVLPFGDSLNLQRLPKSCKLVLVDAAASFDALRKLELPSDKEVGLVFSLHATKLLGAGEGGIFVSNNPAWVKKFKAWTNFGILNNSERVSEFPGTNAKLSEYSAAVALTSLDRWDQSRNLYVELQKRAKKISESRLLSLVGGMKNGYVTPYWNIRTADADRKNRIKKALLEEGIEFRDWWGSGLDLTPAYKSIHSGRLKSTRLLSATTLGLPFHAMLSENDFVRIDSCLVR